MKTKTNNLFPVIAFITAAVITLLANSCVDDPKDENPRFVSARIDNENKSEILAVFSKDIYTDADGFSIYIEEVLIQITGVEGSGTNEITFTIAQAAEYNQDVYIEYDASIGNAEDMDGNNLRSFNKTEVRNYIEKMDLSVLLPSIPPDVKDERVWFILKTDENALNWATNYATAIENQLLSAEPTKTPFDLIVYITTNTNWRPNNADFDSGYYATIIGSSDEYLQYKVVSWVKEKGLSNSNMGHLIDVSAGDDNYSFDKAYTLATDGKDYTEGKIISYTHWYTFFGELNHDYTITLEDNWTDTYYDGKVEAVVMDVYRIPFEEIEPVLSGHPQVITGNDENIYIEVQESERGGNSGSYHIQVIRNF